MIFIIYLLNHGFDIWNFKLQALHVQLSFCLLALAMKGKDIVFRFIIEYSSLRDFGSYVIIGLFLYEDF
jgi:hypothetical protein